MPLHHAVLGLLADGPSYGYELKSEFEHAIGPQWGELNIGHLYQVLDRLVRDGYVTRRTAPQVDRPDRVIYRLTPSGYEELERWKREPSRRQSGFRDDFFLKLFVASRQSPDTIRQVARVQRESYLQELAQLGRLQRERSGDPLVKLLLEAAMLHTKASLRLAELADTDAVDLVTKVERSSAGEEAEGPEEAAEQPRGA